MTPGLAPLSPKFSSTTAVGRSAITYDLTCNRSHRVQQVQWNRVSNQILSSPEDEILPLGHCSLPIKPWNDLIIHHVWLFL
ncbi:hypothetical protein AVEN_199214-1 [Araneus ventricosus]|uniref:Uncharacterized protein n=1 Tax=Araneus ventricosus TaxID=182803 RepID=A0A4Y2AU29_ARAVE|nr:hypothetical protein AVEN_13442-1 [Araneus ventricosus]GBL83521.1 hypothetical protein AVEN_111900-1 [Araneus ventricosus]GBL83538.1 hypothetical protein AVEN_150734-1 [Araneus ventricosus]GBL83574.1 hypothetical protein AVEN_199214-1 [Araneus ventricosus]